MCLRAPIPSNKVISFRGQMLPIARKRVLARISHTTEFFSWRERILAVTSLQA
jgi:hypothetical protein